MDKKKKIIIGVSSIVVVLGLLLWMFGSGSESGMVLIPEGEFILGSNDFDKFMTEKKDFGIQLDLFLDNELPMRKVFLKSFLIDKYEVTNEQYDRFCFDENQVPPGTWIDGEYPEGKDDHPVNNIPWFKAAEYCKWVGKRLPTEEEWEKAARGPDGNRYPWGNEFEIKKGNFDKGDTAPVGSYPEDKSFYGVYDMGGNVMEWTSSWYNPYPENSMKSKDFGEINKVMRGWSGTDVGHYNLPYIFSRSSARHYYLPFGLGDDIGFRCAKDI